MAGAAPGRALELLGECMQHTPTLVELYTFKAKVLKHAGDLEGAAAAADRARSMDLNDRCASATPRCRHTHNAQQCLPIRRNSTIMMTMPD